MEDKKFTSKKEKMGISKIKKNARHGNYVLYKSHIENAGWGSYTDLGITTGTIGQSKRLEALKFTADNYIQGFKARAHVQDKGWLDWVGFNEVIGTVGEDRRLEAIQIYIPPTYATNVKYKVHVENIGWMDYENNNGIAGTTGKSLRIEAFKMHMDIV